MRTKVTLLLTVLTAAAPAVGGPRPAEKGPVPEFKAEGYTLACHTLETSTKIDLAEKGERQHTLALEGVLTRPEREDVVAVTGELKVVAVVDANEDSLLPRSERGAASDRYRKGTYVGLLSGAAKVAVDRLQLAANPYKVRAMTVEAEVIVAKERDQKRLPAVVMQDEAELVPGLKVRITGLRLEKDGEFRVMVRCTRSSGGSRGAFIEKVFALDEDGAIIAGAGWSEGDMFAESGFLTARFAMPAGKAHKALRFIIVTDHVAKTVSFRLRDIFQR